MSCSSRRLVVAALLVLTSACSLDLDVIKRKTVEVIPPSRWSGLDHVGHGVDVLEKDLYYMSQGMTACDYLMAHSTERVVPDQNYFRLLEQGQAARSTLWGHFPIRMDLKGDGTSFKEQANFGGKSALMLRAMDGSIRLDNNPFFEMALMTQGSDLPNKEQFIKMAEDELSASPIRLTFLLGLKLGWSSGILNPYKQRNEIIEKRMNHAFPGVFDAESKARDMSE